ncbi:MAG: ferric reductase-like transmembrane domain-containing protein [Patescibacteria group bacterium]
MKRKEKTRAIIITLLVFLVFSFYIFAKAIFNIGNFQNMNIALFFYLLGKLAGLIGFSFLSLLIFSGDTARFFDRFFGIDKIIKFQRKFALITMIFIFLHPIFFILSSKSILSYIIPNFSIIPSALGIMSFYIFIIVMLASKMYKRISYAVWQFIHILTYILFFFSLYHAFLWGSDSGSLLVAIIYLIILAAIIIGIVYRTSYKIKQRYAGKFYVQGIKNETKDTFTLILKPGKKFLFKAGQFCFLRLNKNKLYARHPFTILSSPEENELRFAVKLAGKFTKALSELKKGEEIIVDGPFGIFTIEDHNKDLIFIAGGVGITPFMSIIKEKIEDNKTQNIVLLYGSKTKEDVIYREQIDNIKKDWFKKAYILSDNSSLNETYGYETGYIDEKVIKKYVKNINNSLFYICGPEPMKNNLKEILSKLGISKQNIIIEDFFW